MCRWLRFQGIVATMNLLFMVKTFFYWGQKLIGLICETKIHPKAKRITRKWHVLVEKKFSSSLSLFSQNSRLHSPDFWDASIRHNLQLSLTGHFFFWIFNPLQSSPFRLKLIGSTLFESMPGISNCCRMEKKSARTSRKPLWRCFDGSLRLIMPGGDEGLRGSEMIRAVARSGHSPSLTQPVEPPGYVGAFCESVYLCLWLCLCVCFSAEKNAFRESRRPSHRRTTQIT